MLDLYSESNDDVGSHTVTVEVVDAAGAKDQATFSITVNNINDNPVFDTIPAVEADEDENFTYQLLATDVDAGDVLTFQGVDLPDWLSVSETGLLTGTPSNDDVGSHTVTVEVVDTAGAKDQATFSITVNNINDNPVFDTIPAVEADEDENFTYQLLATDVDAGDVLTFQGVDLPDWLSVSETGLLTGTPSNDDVGSHTVTVEVVDAAGAKDQATFSITVNNINDNPVFDTIPAVEADEDENFTYQLLATDVDAGDVLTFQGVDLPDWLSVSDNPD